MSIYKYWGKASLENKTDYHLLVYHCLDVAAVADIWLTESRTLLKQITAGLKTTQPEAKQIMLFYILLHDLGKFDARFQNFREDIRRKLQGDEYEIERDPVYYSHGSCGYQQFCEINGDTSEAMKAVAGHHGYCDTAIDYYEPTADEPLIELDEQARREWIEFCLAFCELKTIPEVGEVPLLAGLCSVSDWIGSSMTNYTTNPSLDLSEYYQKALRRAKQALDEAGLLKPLQGAGFQHLFKEYQPRGIQLLLNNLPIEAGLTLVESDTGSGKTEFALAYASMLIQAGLADGIVFGLPTQATANGLFDRIGDATDKLFPDATTTLAHGKSRYLFSDESGFLHQSNKRAFLGPMSVATIDQILMGVLGVRHQFVRSFGARKSVLILDEIHSFDAYMVGLIEQVLKGQHEAFGSVILLSATMPEALKERLLSCYSGVSSSKAYPLISHTNLQGCTQEFTVADDIQAVVKTITSQCWQSEDVLPTLEQITQVCHWVNEGAMVAIICNTVKDAQRLYYRITQHSTEIPVDLFHARYTFADRQQRETQVLDAYGKHAKRAGRLLIATQVVEQSLDLDFDIIISQVAPIELLMQRMGRLWRHERQNTELSPRSDSVKEPLFITLYPHAPDESYTEQQWKLHYQNSGFVYKNTRLLYRTEQFLSERDRIHFPACYREGIDFVHNESPYKHEPEALTALAENYGLSEEGNNHTARMISQLQSKPLNDVDPRCALLTRDGEMGEPVVLFNTSGSLLNGGDYQEQADRDNSTLSLAKKYVKGKKDPDNFCTKVVVGKDVIYNHMGFISDDLQEELNKGN